MNSKIVKCCAKNCPTILTSDCYRFPEEPELAREFLTILEREDLLSLSIDQLRDNYLFCPLHVDVVPDEPSPVGEDKVARGPARQALRQPLANVQDSGLNIYPSIPLVPRRYRQPQHPSAPSSIYALPPVESSGIGPFSGHSQQITRLMCSFCGLLFFDPVSCKNHMSENHALSRVTQARTSEGDLPVTSERIVQKSRIPKRKRDKIKLLDQILLLFLLII